MGASEVSTGCMLPWRMGDGDNMGWALGAAAVYRALHENVSSRAVLAPVSCHSPHERHEVTDQG